MDINELIKKLENEHAAKLRAAQDIVSAVKRDNRGYTERENATLETLDSELERLDASLESARDAQAEERELDHGLANPVTPPGRVARGNVRQTAQWSIGRESRTYHPDNDPQGNMFISDLMQEFLNGGRGHGESAQRMERHVRESLADYPHLEKRTSNGVGTSAFTGLVVPNYLVDALAPAIANMRPLADAIGSDVLPETGMSLNISKITTASSADLQANELDTVSATDMDDTLLTVNISTVAGQQLVSRQALERGTGVENVVVGDLLRRVASRLDYTMINAATHGLTNTATATTYTDASPTGAELLVAIYQAESALEQALIGIAVPNLVVMHPRRWNWLCSQTATDHPLINNNPAQLGQGRYDSLDSLKIRGYLNNGLPVITDANIPTNLGTGTNQDEVYVLATDSVYLWEGQGQPVMLRAEQPKAANLGVLLVAYEYLAWTYERFANGTGKVSGTGLVAPAGF